MICCPASEYKPVRKNTTVIAPAFNCAVGQLQIFSRVLRYTVTMPRTTPKSSRQVEPCAVSQAQNAVIQRSLHERRETADAGLLHASGRLVDRGQRRRRRAADFDVGHRMNRRDVVVEPGV